MRIGIDKLRIWLVAGASLLLLVVVGFLGFARYRSRVFLAGLPGRLGVGITRETDGITYSQSVEGRTIFTLHAAKMEQRKDGLVKLHDVGVVVYGRRQDRADRIYGKEFEYDQAAGIVRALGAVSLDLQAPAPGEGKKQRPVSATGAPLASTDARVIHVTTSGLVYLTKLGVAATGEDVEFSEGGITGQAHGADFNTDTGLVVLQSAVRVNGSTGNGPMVLTAGRAELDRNNQVANLSGAKLVTATETVEVQQATVHTRKDGSIERMEGAGRVTIVRAGGEVLSAERADATLSAAGKPEEARFGGNVRFVEDDATRHAEGRSDQTQVRFNGAGQAERVAMSGGVMIAQRQDAAAGKAASRKTLSGARVEVALGPVAGPGRKTEIREAHATGAARLVMVNEVPPKSVVAAGAETTDLAGDEMIARFASGQRIAGLVATGHTVLHQMDAAGLDERSVADTTELVFRPSTGEHGHATASDLETGFQAGHVAMVRTSVKVRDGLPVRSEQHGMAERAVFDAATNRVTMTGNVALSDAASMLGGDKVVLERASGDATAEGGVRLTYLQSPQEGRESEPVHVLADHAVLRQGPAKAAKNGSVAVRGGEDRAFFYGVAGRPARLWQGGSQVEAPVLEFEQVAKRLTASGPGDGPQVHALLVPSDDPSARPPVPKANRVAGKPAGAVRVVSHEMIYTEEARQISFLGDVQVEDAEGRMRAERATAFLQAGSVGRTKAPGGDPGQRFGGSIQRIVATGKIELDQPGRHGTGEQVVYTANDGMFVLTGTPALPPRLTDEAKGTVTGAALRFHSGDDSVVVTGSGIERGAGANVATKQVRTETRVKQQ